MSATSDKPGLCAGGYVGVHDAHQGPDRATCPSCGRSITFDRITGKFRRHKPTVVAHDRSEIDRALQGVLDAVVGREGEDADERRTLRENIAQLLLGRLGSHGDNLDEWLPLADEILALPAGHGSARWVCSECGWPWPLNGPPVVAECDNCGGELEEEH